MSEKHIADAESDWRVCNISPDMCIVNGQVVPFEIYRELTPEKSNYASSVHARGCKVLHVDSGYHVVGMKAIDAPDIALV